MKIYLMRHGQTTGDIEDRYGGDYEDHLTDLGRTQAKELAEKLLNLNIETIYYSPRIRATETAEIIEQVTKIPLELENDLRERNAYGILTGKLKSEVEETDPELIELLKNPKATITGAEEYNSFKNRVTGIFNKIANSGSETVGIVTHGGVISCFLREIIGRERKSLGDCAMIELEYSGGKFILIKSDGLELEE
ncbi:MAG: histidine phosphatase family protein [Candidatus Berkelbacteria bacterium]